MTLYEISDELRALFDAVDDGGDLGPDQAEQIDALEGDLASKAENIAKLVRNLEADAIAYAGESERLHHAMVRAKARADWLKNYLMGNMQRLGLPRIDAGLFTIRVQRNSRPSVVCTAHLDELPPDLVRRKVVLSVDCDAVLQSAKEGGELPAGVRVELGSHLRIS